MQAAPTTKLTLDKSYDFFGRSIKSFDCRLESYGWSGRIA